MMLRIIAILFLGLFLPACAHDVLVEKPAAGFSPPGELMVAPPPLARLDSSKPMPLSEFLEVVSDDTESHLDVAQRLAKLQLWGQLYNGWARGAVSLEEPKILQRREQQLADMLETPLRWSEMSQETADDQDGLLQPSKSVDGDQTGHP